MESWRRTPAALCFLALFLGGAPTEAAKRALIVGVNDYQHLPVSSSRLGREMPDLRGAVNDARGMAEALARGFDFQPEDIKTLIDEHATREAILAAFRDWLVEGTTPGDVAVFYFSGHGAVVPDDNGDEDDGLDEALGPHDLAPLASTVGEARVILDDELGRLVAQLEGRSVVVIVDACHSGTITRSVRSRVVSSLEQTPGRGPAKFVWLDDIVGRRGAARDVWSPEDLWDSLPHQLILSSSRARQVSVEIATPGGAFHGAFTSALLERMRQAPAPSYRELHAYAQDVLRDRLSLPQEPQIEAFGQAALDSTAFDGFLTAFEGGDEPSKFPTPVVQEEIPANLPSPTEPADPQVLLRVEALNGTTSAQSASLRERFESLPYVQLTDGKHFDRLLRGGVGETDTYDVRLLNSPGDVLTRVTGASASVVVEHMAPHLEYAYLTKKLARIWTPAPAFQVDLSVAQGRRDFALGETVVFEIGAALDCYVLLFNIDSTGAANLLFPNRYSQDNFVGSGRIVQIPNESMQRNQFEFRFFPPAGEETFKLIATNKPLDLEELGDGAWLFGDPAPGQPLAVSSPSRELVNQLVLALTDASRSHEFRWSEDTVVLRSHGR